LRVRPAGKSSPQEPVPIATFDLLLLGAGSGSRFGSPDKLFRPIGPASLLNHCVMFWARFPQISNLIITLPPGRRLQKDTIVPQGDHGKNLILVRGGATRQESVYNALKKTTAWNVVIQDVARPTLYEDDVESLFRAMETCEAATLGTPARDTLIRAPDGVFAEILPRNSAWQVFTPQAFRTAVIREAHQWARKHRALFTDDFTLACLFTRQSRIIETHHLYLKVTYPEDEMIWRNLLKLSG
jgi:2-C-methyl-D-erythritol 4-phosphate cytidylyltransferase